MKTITLLLLIINLAFLAINIKTHYTLKEWQRTLTDWTNSLRMETKKVMPDTSHNTGIGQPNYAHYYIWFKPPH